MKSVMGRSPQGSAGVQQSPLAVLVRNFPVIRGECENLMASSLRIPGMEELTSYTSGGIHQIAWKSFMFKSGSFIEENCALAPKTAALLRGIPGVYTAFFSVLEPQPANVTRTARTAAGTVIRINFRVNSVFSFGIMARSAMIRTRSAMIE